MLGRVGMGGFPRGFRRVFALRIWLFGGWWLRRCGGKDIGDGNTVAKVGGVPLLRWLFVDGVVGGRGDGCCRSESSEVPRL